MNEAVSLACKKMCKSVRGGVATVAREMDISYPSLKNRLNGHNGQKISIEQALEMQDITGSSEFAKAVAHESGGVFIKLPEVGVDITEEDINRNAMLAAEKLGKIFAQIREFSANGQLDDWELDEINKTKMSLLGSVASVVYFAAKYYTADGIENAAVQCAKSIRGDVL